MNTSIRLSDAMPAPALSPKARIRRFRWPLAAALIGLITGFCGILSAAPVTVPDASFEEVVFPLTTNALSPGGTGAVFNNAQLVPIYYWWGAGSVDQTGFPTEYIQNADSTNGIEYYPLNTDGTMVEPGDGTNYLVLGGSGDENVWQPLGALLPNTVYTLTVAVGLDALDGYGNGTGNNGGGTALVALVGGNEIYDIFSPGAILASMQVETTNNNEVVPGLWVDNTLVFTNGYQTSGNLTILLRGTGGFAVDLDNIRLDATPATFTAVTPTVTTDTGSSSTTVYQGTMVTLSENPVGTAPFTYGWRTDNGSGGATWTGISGANAATYVANTASINPGTPVEFEVVVTNSAGVSTSGPVALSTITGAPVLTKDTLPSAGSFDVVGSQVAFNASFDGSRPITYQWQLNGTNIPGATNTTLTVALTSTNQTGDYGLIASNILGTNASTAQLFTVDTLAPATNGIVLADGMEYGSFYQTLGYNDAFNPTWTIAPNSLIAGIVPSSSIGIFTDSGCGGLPVLTAGTFAGISPPDNGSICFATAGSGTSSNTVGYSITYTLPTTESGAGWTITNIVTYGGWADDGRDEQSFQVSYSSPLAPTNFSGLLPWTAFNPPNPPTAVYGDGVAIATKMSIIPTNGVLAQNVAAVNFNFYSLAAGQTPKNGWEGYAQIQLFGTPSTNLPPALTQPITPAIGADVVGSSVTIEAAFISPEPLTYTWLQDGVPLAGQTSPVLTLTNLQLTNTSVNPGYVLQASNSLGVASTKACPFTVNPAPTPDGNGVIFSDAYQAALGGLFTPTWTIGTNNLLYGELPFSYTGNVADGGGSPGVVALTDGIFGTVGEGNDSYAASLGNSIGSGGEYLFYNLPPSPYGWNITSIESYGGWSDVGRNQQGYDFLYATTGAPGNYVDLDTANYNPPLSVAEPNAGRVIWTPGSGSYLATNVTSVEFNFTTVGVKNSWEGYNELQVFGTQATGPQEVTPEAPIIVNDIAPGYASNVVGNQEVFTTSFTGTAPVSYQWQYNDNVGGGLVNINDATNETLTLNDLTTNMAGSYQCVASNATGTTTSSSATLIVVPQPAPVNGIIYAYSSQIDGNFGLGFDPTAFVPTWNIAPGSLIAGKLPSTVGPGNFADDGDGAGGVPALTDGKIGLLVSGGAAFPYATCGSSGGLGSYVIYTLGSSPDGYNISNIVTYGGWPDYGRDWQYYTVSYSTAAHPTNFTVLGQSTFAFSTMRAGAAPTSGQVTWIPANGGLLASNVAAVKFDFTTPAGQENGWQGYSELQVFGAPSPIVPQLEFTSTKVSGGNLILSGSGGTPGAAYYWLTTTNLALPLSEWTTNGTGVFDSNGDFSSTNAINHAPGALFYRLGTP